MQKKLIALAIAGLVSGGALAQSNVTMYGVLDANVNWSDSGFGRKMQVGTGGYNASRFGFRGSEDMGGGTKAVFVLEAGLSMDTQTMGAGAPANTGAGNAGNFGGINNTVASTGGAPGTGPQIFSRQGLVGLEGAWGTVHLGRLYTATYTGTAVIADPVVGGLYGGLGNIQSSGLVPRVNNGITYKTPNMNGLYGWFTYSAGSENNVSGPVQTTATTTACTATTSCTNDKAGRGYDLAGIYQNGPANAILSYWHFNRPSWAPGEYDLATAKGFLLAGNYDFGPVRLFGAYLSGKIDGGNYENVTKAYRQTKTWYVGASIPVSAASRVVANYAHFDDQSPANKDFKEFGLAYVYDMSKRTLLYTAYGKLSNSATANQALVTAGDLVGNVTVAGTSPTGFMIGTLHRF